MNTKDAKNEKPRDALSPAHPKGGHVLEMHALDVNISLTATTGDPLMKVKGATNAA